MERMYGEGGQSQGHEYSNRPGTASTASQSGDFGSRPNVIFDGKRMRKPVHRRTVDYSSTVVRYLQVRMWQRDVRDAHILQPTPAASADLLPAVAYPDNPSTSFATKFVHPSTNKVRCSINRVLWTPTGRRLITGSQSGEFTLWNGLSFNFEMILQAHDLAVRSMVWSHNENWMVTGDDGGCIKYWQTNMNNVKANKTAHKEAVRDLSFSSTDLKFCSCSDDTTVKVWDFARCQEERSLAGHGWDVKSVDWHPQKSLLVSGAKDNLVKLWDAKTGKELSTLHGHKNTVLSVKWNSNGNWVITASRDQTIKLYDIRTLQELESYRGHRKEVTSLAWHPFHEELFVSGSYDGSIIHWLVGHEVPQAEVANAHESSVWDLAWHPMGHILCSGSNDHTTKFWCRNRPGDSLRDCRQAIPHSQGSDASAQTGGRTSSAALAADGPTTPGPFAAGGPVRAEGAIPGVGMAMPMPQAPADNAVTAPGLQAVVGVMNPSGVPINPPPPSTPYPSAAQSPLQQQQQPQMQHHQQVAQQNQQQQVQQGLHGLSGLPLQVAPSYPQQPPGLPPHLMQQSVLPLPPPGPPPPPPAPNAGPFGQGQQPLRPMMGPSPPMGLPPMLTGPGLGVQMGMGVPTPFGAGPQRPAGMVPNVSTPFGTSGASPMAGPMVANPAANTFQGSGPPAMMDVRGMNVGLSMGMAMGLPPHPHGPGPPPPHT
ncbi:hypothetical protein R1sor_017960 [Riccia sorocarpa]|uniref:Flowering time control protein FY n=1 Tax=Riccia sorocarpa TaxID=122646 RepID=A0ABD3I8E7_9MARC